MIAADGVAKAIVKVAGLEEGSPVVGEIVQAYDRVVEIIG